MNERPSCGWLWLRADNVRDTKVKCSTCRSTIINYLFFHPFPRLWQLPSSNLLLEHRRWRESEGASGAQIPVLRGIYRVLNHTKRRDVFTANISSPASFVRSVEARWHLVFLEFGEHFGGVWGVRDAWNPERLQLSLRHQRNNIVLCNIPWRVKKKN